MNFLSPIRKLSITGSISNDLDNTNPNHNNCYVYLTDAGIIKNISEGFEKLIGISKYELIGQTLNEAIRYKRNSKLNYLLASLSADKPFAQTKLKIVNAQNEVIKTELYLTLTSLKEGAPIFAIFRLSGTHQNKYDDLFEKKEKLRILAENTNHVQLLFDTNLKCIYISPSCYQLSGYKYKELLDADFYKLIHHADFDNVWEKLNTPSSKKEETIVFRITHKKGYNIYVEARIKKVIDKFNTATHYAVYINDATRQIQCEQQLLKSRNLAESSNELKTQFLTSISHEFRTPLNAIIGFSKIISKTIKEQPHHTFLRKIELSGIQLLSMVDNLLNFSRIEKNELKASISSIDLGLFFKGLESQMREQWDWSEKTNLKVFSQFELLENKEFVFTDQKLLEKIFINLINNAVKFTEEGHVKYGCKAYGVNDYLFYVEDTGIGIPVQYHTIIFDALTQVDNSLTREYEGAGIGLSVTKKMINILGGEIWLNSTEGKGTTFYFTLPLSKI
jgi:PAS domain S-box-containing protein